MLILALGQDEIRGIVQIGRLSAVVQRRVGRLSAAAVQKDPQRRFRRRGADRHAANDLHWEFWQIAKMEKVL